MVFNTLLRVVKSLLKTKRIAFRFFPDFHIRIRISELLFFSELYVDSSLLICLTNHY